MSENENEEKKAINSVDEFAENIINDFYEVMPYNDSKLFKDESLENPDVIINMEIVAAKQCAVKSLELMMKESAYVDGAITIRGKRWEFLRDAKELIESQITKV